MSQVYVRNNRPHGIILRTGNAAVTIPAGEQGPAGFAPGYKRVDASFIEEARKNHVVRGYFDEGHLALEPTPEQREKAELAARQASDEVKRKAAAEAAAKAAAETAAREQAEAEAAAKAAVLARACADADLNSGEFAELDEEEQAGLLAAAAEAIAADAKKDEGKAPKAGKKK